MSGMMKISVIAWVAVVFPFAAHAANTCSAAEQKSLEYGSALINAQVELMRHELSYISPQDLDSLRQNDPETVAMLRKALVLTAEDEASYRKSAAARLCEELSADDRRKLAGFYQGEEGKELARQQLGLYKRLFVVHSQIFQNNLIKALLTSR